MAIIEGSINGYLADVTFEKELKTALTTTSSKAGWVGIGSVNDDGQIIGTKNITSPETDSDFRLRIAHDNVLDNEIFNYISQNTAKHSYATSTLTNQWTTTGLITNVGSLTTGVAGTIFGTYNFFTFLKNTMLYCEFDLSFSAQPVTNCIIDFGLFNRNGVATPNDGVYFRLNSSGLVGVANNNGTETTVNLPFAYENSEVHNFIISVSTFKVQFWINNVLYGEIVTPTAQGIPFASPSLPLSVRHFNPATTSGVIQCNIKSYSVSFGGINVADDLGTLNNRVFGSYQGLSGGTMGSLSVYTNSTNPTAAVPSNTVLTANLPAGLGGQAWETFTTGLAANVDGILMSYQLPAGTVSVQGKRLKVTGVKMSAFVQTVLTGGGFNSTFALAFGSTAVSLATGEGVAAKARRIVLLPEFTQTVASGAAALTLIQQNSTISTFSEPIYVNQGEFIQFTVKHIGTVATAGVIAYNIQYIYSWE